MSKRQLNVKIDEDLYDALSKKVDANNISMAFLVETLVSLFVNDKIIVEKKTIIDVKLDDESR